MNAPTIYQALAIKGALKFYAKTGQKVNSAYTPKAMMATASRITGLKFKPRDYETAIKALDTFIQETTL
jgi:hypothetical protein